MKTFKINKNLEIVCEWKKTRIAFKHEATLLQDGWKEIDKAKICYLNRTWESFEFESVIQKLLDKTNLLTERQKKNFLKKASGRTTEETSHMFKAIKTISSMGDILGQTKKEKIDWKVRMLKAGLGDKGLQMPEDWNELSEDEQEKRLEGALKVLK